MKKILFVLCMFAFWSCSYQWRAKDIKNDSVVVINISKDGFKAGDTVVLADAKYVLLEKIK